MPEFKSITLEDRDIIEKYLNIMKYPNSEYSFGSFYAWEDALNMKYAIIEDCLCVIYRPKNKLVAYFPAGARENVMKAFYAMNDYFKEQGEALIFTSLSEPMIDILKEEGIHDQFEIEEKRNFFDYVYTREKLVELRGKKLNGKRNHYNYFVNNYSFSMVDIDESNEEACKKEFREVIMARSTDADNELVASVRMLEGRKEMNLSGKALYVEDKLIGVILGGKHHDLGLIHIAKADVEYRGASVALFKHYLEDCLTDCEYVNLMEDMGIEGLRKSKLAFRPDYMVEKFSYLYKG